MDEIAPFTLRNEDERLPSPSQLRPKGDPMGETPPRRTIHLIESDETEPRVKLKPGKRYEVVATPVVDRDLRQVDEEAKRPVEKPPRLCGSRSTCVAIIEIPFD
jgi:hypothetical protein